MIPKKPAPASEPAKKYRPHSETRALSCALLRMRADCFTGPKAGVETGQISCGVRNAAIDAGRARALPASSFKQNDPAPASRGSDHSH